MRVTTGLPMLAGLVLAGCATAGSPAVSPATRHAVPADAQIVRYAVYPKDWAGERAAWVDVVVRNTATAPRQFRAVVTVDDEPPFAVSSDKPVPPGGDGTLTVSTSARRLPTRVHIQVETLD